MFNNNSSLPIATLRHANSRMLNRYIPWMDYMLTITFGKGNMNTLPNAEQVHRQLRHLKSTLNRSVWSNQGRFNDKCSILYVPIIEGKHTSTRIHAHILLGNVKSRCCVDMHLSKYIPQSDWIAARYDLRNIYDPDGIAWYLAKETHRINVDAIAWELASIPKPLLPR